MDSRLTCNNVKLETKRRYGASSRNLVLLRRPNEVKILKGMGVILREYVSDVCWLDMSERSRLTID